MMPSCCSASAPIDISVRARVLNAITRITRAEAAALGAVRDPRVQLGYSFPAVVNDEAPPREPAERNAAVSILSTSRATTFMLSSRGAAMTARAR